MMPRVRLVSRWSSAGARRTKVFFRLIFRQSCEERVDLAAEVLLGDALRDRADDDAAGILGQQLGDHLPELGPLLAALDLPAHPDLGGVGHVDQEAAGEGDLRGDPAALGADRLLGHLDREGLALLEDVLDVGQRAAGRDLALPGLRRRSVALPPPLPLPRRRRSAPARHSVRRSPAASSTVRPADRGGLGSASALVLLAVLLFVRLLVLVRLQQVGGVEEGALLLPDVHEGGLDAREHRLDPAEIDVADRAAMVGAVDQQLDQPVVFQDGHAGLPLAPVDQDLALQACPTSAEDGGRKTNAPPGASFVEVEEDTSGPRGGRSGIGVGQRSQSTTSPRICRAITIRWISLVPSPISQTLASRIIRSTGYSVV